MKKKTFIVILIIEILVIICFILGLEVKRNKKVATFNPDSTIEFDKNNSQVTKTQTNTQDNNTQPTQNEQTTTNVEGTTQPGETNFFENEIPTIEKSAQELTIKDIKHAQLGEQNILKTTVRNNGSMALKGQLMRIQILDKNGKEIENAYSVIESIEPGQETEWNTKITSKFEDIGDIQFSKVVLSETMKFNN